jgi:hypothetical protein
VDNNLHDYNMDLEKFADAVNENTRAVIPTHLFGYPMDVIAIQEIVRAAENKFGHKIFIIQDCAHSFEAEWQGHSVIRSGDGALFGLNISKQINSIFGGMFTTDDEKIAIKLKHWRDERFMRKSFAQVWLRRAYLAAVYIAFNPSLYGLTYWLQYNSPFLKGLTDAYHLDEKIHFPQGAQERDREDVSRKPERITRLGDAARSARRHLVPFRHPRPGSGESDESGRGERRAARPAD